MSNIAIIDGFTATISGHTVVFPESQVNWRTLNHQLCKAVGIPFAERGQWVPQENKPGAEIGDHIWMHDLTEPKDYVLINLERYEELERMLARSRAAWQVLCPDPS